MLRAPLFSLFARLIGLQAASMDSKCHARVYEDLTQINYDRLVWQVLGCRGMIESALGRRPRSVAYPSGIYNGQVIALFASDHYWGGITTRQGVGTAATSSSSSRVCACATPPPSPTWPSSWPCWTSRR